MSLKRSLGTLALVFVLYFNTSGGPHTTEGLVAELGPGLALLLLILVPIFWSLPEVLIIGELSSMLPEEGGYYKWVQRAFGEFWAFQNGWLTWMYSLVDMALYPLLFNQYLAYLLPDLSKPVQWAISLGVIWGATAINLRGASRVGVASIVAGVFVLGTFFSLAFASLPHATHVPWLPFMKPGENATHGLAVGLSIALWNYIGWDNASTVGGEIKESSSTYPRALSIALPLVIVGNFVPLLSTLAASDWTQWREGGWPQIALMSAGSLGPILAPMTSIAGMASALAFFNALLMAYSRIPYVMATDGLLPKALSRTDERGTPRNSVLASAVVYSVVVLAQFESLLIADVLLYAMALMLEFGALIALRKNEPNLRGAFRIPLPRGGVMALAAVPLAILFFVIGVSFYDGEYGIPAVAGAAIASAAGPLAYRWAKRRQLRPS